MSHYLPTDSTTELCYCHLVLALVDTHKEHFYMIPKRNLYLV